MKMRNDGAAIRKGSCPTCRSTEVVPIIYGVPTPELVDEARVGRIVLGGCAIQNERWCCKRCGHRWGRRCTERLHWPLVDGQVQLV